MTRLLVCSSTFPLSADDRRTARFVYDLAAALARRMDVVVLAPHHGGAAGRETLGPLEVRRFRYAWPARAQRLAAGAGVMPALRRSWLGRLQAPAYLFAFRQAAARLIASGGFDAVNSHWLVPAGWAAYRAAARAHVPHLLTIHAADVFLLQRLPAGRRLAARIIRGAAACFADSAFINAELSELVGFEVGAYPATAGVDAAAFAPQYEPAAAKQLLGWPPRPTVLFVGRMVEKKGLPYLVAAMAEVKRTRDDVRLVLAGDGPERAAAESQVRELGVEDAVAFLGPKSHDELKLMYNAADWLVVPSIVDRNGETEGMPTVILEAFAAACPVVGTRVAGIPEFVHEGETGFLAAPKDGDALAAALLQALGRGRGPFRAACLARAAAYDFAVLAERYEQALREAR